MGGFGEGGTIKANWEGPKAIFIGMLSTISCCMHGTCVCVCPLFHYDICEATTIGHQ